jgi:hypothetical protein
MMAMTTSSSMSVKPRHDRTRRKNAMVHLQNRYGYEIRIGNNRHYILGRDTLSTKFITNFS